MGRSAYPKTNCIVCGQTISTAGLGKASHMKAHIRKGEAFAVVVESRRSNDKTTTYYPIAALERHRATDERKRNYIAAGMIYRVVDAATKKIGGLNAR